MRVLFSIFLLCISRLESLVAADRLEVFDELRVDPDSNQIVDSRGRTRIFHGVNFVAKRPPWYHPPLLEPTYAKHLADWGLNVVRLGIMWSGLEPTEGVYDPEYLEKMQTIVRNFENHGVWVLLDVHQDVASKRFGTYDGFPDWLVEKLREDSERQFPWPLKQVDNWFCGYVTYEAGHVYQGFYNNKYNAVDKFAALWGYIAQNFKDFKNIVGYDLMNEPWVGNIYQDGGLVMPGVAGQQNLLPMYNKAVSRIREVDRKTLIFWEPVTWSHWMPSTQVGFMNRLMIDMMRKLPLLSTLNLISRACGGLDVNITSEDQQFCQGLTNSSSPRASDGISSCIPASNTTAPVNSAFGSGLKSIPGGDQEAEKSVMSWHYYFPLFVYDKADHPWYMKNFAHNVFGPMVFNGVDKEVRRLGGGQFLSEFGLCEPDMDRPDSWRTKECNYVLNKADQHSLSWTYWDTSNLGVLWDDAGQPVPSIVKGMSRPYPTIVAGSNVKYSYNLETNSFTLKFNPASDGETLVYVPPALYEDLPSVRSSPDLKHYFHSTSHFLIVRKTDEAVQISGKSWIKISPEENSLRREEEGEGGILNNMFNYLNSINPFGKR